MPIWLELIVVLLAAYGIGVLLGWLAWGRTVTVPVEDLEREHS